MKIRMITLAAGPCGVFSPGKVYTVADAMGKAFVEGGYAKRLDASVEVVRESIPWPERSISSLDLGDRVVSALSDAGLTTLGELDELEGSLAAIDGITKGAVKKIAAALEASRAE